jgi:4-amino-4-deoxy-L-arabinose transferase-like glycosyltransferase
LSTWRPAQGFSEKAWTLSPLNGKCRRGTDVEAGTLADRAEKALDLFIDALTDVARRDHAAILALAVYLAIWTLYGVIAKGNQDLHPDMTELVAWSRDLALGYPKHPPFAADVVRGWFALFPINDWSYYLLAILTSTITLWVGWRQFADYLDPTKCVVALALLMFIPFFNFHALKFNVNTVLMPLWALSTYWFLRSYRTCSPTYAALAGICGALCMLSKYWSIFLLGGLAIAALVNHRRVIYFRTPAPWITLATGLAVVSPHLGWLQKHHFSPMQYAMAVHGGHSVAEAVQADIHYLIDAAAYVIVPVLLVMLALRVKRQSVGETLWPSDPDLQLVAVAFWATLLLPTLAALFWGVEIHAIWSMSMWTLLPVLLLSPLSADIARPPVRLIVGTAIAFPLAMLALAPAIAATFQVIGIGPEQAHGRMLATQVEAAWQQATPRPLRYVGGDMANSVLTYASSRPEPLPDSSRYQSARIADSGVAMTCFAEDAACLATANEIAARNPASRIVETELTRRYHGIAGPTQRYSIFIVPPM